MHLMLPPSYSPGQAHDHSLCTHQALEHAVSLCLARGERLTALRKRVLELIWQHEHRPIGAYELIDKLRQERKNTVAPPTVYRSLDFLLAQGLIHRLDSCNAYIGCHHKLKGLSFGDERENLDKAALDAAKRQSAHALGTCFLLCDSCEQVEELEDPLLNQALNNCAARHRFHISGRTIELHGQCQACQSAAKPTAPPAKG
jgi:Fur family transcriptional regulator, zinc uptake regulator